MGEKYLGYSNLCAESGGSSVDQNYLPPYEEAVSQEFINRTTIVGSKSGADNQHLTTGSQVDYVPSTNEHRSALVTEYCGSNQVQLMPNYNVTYQRHKDPNMLLIYISVFLVVSMATWAIYYAYFTMVLKL